MIYLCITTVGADTAATLARRLVDERLAACANILPGARSIYRWRGEVCDEPESLLLIKTSAERLAELERRFRELHPYECPELLVLPIERGAEAYFRWVEESTAE